MSNSKDVEKLDDLRVMLKSGEYDGTQIMQAWIAIDRLIKLMEWQDKVFYAHPNIDMDIKFTTEQGA